MEKDYSNYKIIDEYTEDEKQFLFGYKKEKFRHNIDSLYYTIKLKEDFGISKFADRFALRLADLQQQAKQTQEPYFYQDYIFHPHGLPRYNYFLEMSDKYAMFISDRSHEGKNITPEIWVQIRSQWLWLYGEHYCVKESLEEIEGFLALQSLEIENVQENRIDYAYHTNYIQDPLNFFKHDQLNSMQVSNFKRYSLEGAFIGEDQLDCDYFTMGRKKSNNLFFRAYNKTKEVIEKGYKQFFIQLWQHEKMISFYDAYCIEKAFAKQSYNYLDLAKLEFYLEYGKDLVLKEQLEIILQGYPQNYNLDQIRNLTKALFPSITIVTNIEIETKRKFYSSLDESVDLLLKLKSGCPAYANKLFVKLDNKKVFHKHITQHVVRFIRRDTNERKSRCETAYWWKRLQACKLNNKFTQEEIDLFRKYQTALDLDKMKTKTLSTISTLALYKNGEEGLEQNFYEDVLDVLALLNENDIQKISMKKNKKFAVIKNRLKATSAQVKSDYTLIDKKTGELIS